MAFRFEKNFFTAKYKTSLSELGWTPKKTNFGTSYEATVEFEGKYLPFGPTKSIKPTKNIGPTKSKKPIIVKGIAKLTLADRYEGIADSESVWSLAIEHSFTVNTGKTETLNTRINMEPKSIAILNGTTTFFPSLSQGALNPTTSTTSLNNAGTGAMSVIDKGYGMLHAYAGQNLLKSSK